MDDSTKQPSERDQRYQSSDLGCGALVVLFTFFVPVLTVGGLVYTTPRPSGPNERTHIRIFTGTRLDSVSLAALKHRACAPQRRERVAVSRQPPSSRPMREASLLSGLSLAI